MNKWRNTRIAIGRGTRTIMPDGRIIAVPYHGEVIWRDNQLMQDFIAANREYKKDKDKIKNDIAEGSIDIDLFLAGKGMIMYGEESNNGYYVRFSKPTGAALRSLVTLLPRAGKGGTIHVLVYGKGEETLTIDEFIDKYL